MFTATQPLRYLAFVVSRFTHSATATVVLPNRTLPIAVVTTPREERYGREFADRAADIVRFYASLLDDYPYAPLRSRSSKASGPAATAPATSRRSISR